MIDAAGSAIPLAHGIGRIGCFFAGCCYGAPTGPEWAGIGLRFPTASPAWNDHVRRLWITSDSAYSLPVWPTQLMEAAFELTMAAIFALYFLRRPARKGDVMLRYLLVYGIFRAFVET